MNPLTQSPELRLGDVSNLCSYGPRPQLMTGLFVQLLRQQFAADALIEEASLRGGTAPLIWAADARNTGITIESAMTWKPEESMTRPALVIHRDDWHVDRMGIGNKLMGYQPCSDGQDRYAISIQGSHTLFAIGEELESEYLGAEVYRNMIQFGEVFRQYFQLQRFTVASIGAPGRIQEVAEAYTVPVTVAYSFEDVWVVTRQSPKLKNITISSILGAA